MMKKMGRMMGKAASMMKDREGRAMPAKPRGRMADMVGRAMSGRAMPGSKEESERPEGRGLMKRIGRAMAGKRMAFKEGGMADKKGRAMKKTDADAMGRAMKSKAKPKKKMGGGMMKKGY